MLYGQWDYKAPLCITLRIKNVDFDLQKIKKRKQFLCNFLERTKTNFHKKYFFSSKAAKIEKFMFQKVADQL